jgi:hypothetical protein
MYRTDKRICRLPTASGWRYFTTLQSPTAFFCLAFPWPLGLILPPSLLYLTHVLDSSSPSLGELPQFFAPQLTPQLTPTHSTQPLNSRSYPHSHTPINPSYVRRGQSSDWAQPPPDPTPGLTADLSDLDFPSCIFSFIPRPSHPFSRFVLIMILELHVWGPAFTLPSIDPRCLAAIAYLTHVVPRDQWVLIAGDRLALSSSSESYMRQVVFFSSAQFCLYAREEVADAKFIFFLSFLGELPSLRHGSTWIGGFRNIVEYLRQFGKGWDLDSCLTRDERADCIA